MRDEGSRVRVLIADDHALFRSGMRLMLEREPDFEVVAEAADGREAVEHCKKKRPDLILMDVGMPGMNGIEATREIKNQQPDVSVLIVTAYPDPAYLPEAVEAGAAGYVLKTATPEQISDAVRRVFRNEFPLDEGLTRHLIQTLARRSETQGRRSESASGHGETLPGLLTARETEVLRLLAVGNTNRQIAHVMHFSLSTVKRHLERIISKLGVSDRTQAAVRAVELGLLVPERGRSHLRLLSGENEPPDHPN